MKQNARAEFFVAFCAILLGLGIAAYLHAKWYSGGWMGNFGDPPSSNPAYGRLAPLLQSPPYAAAGVVSGLVSGAGSLHWRGSLIRQAAIILFLLVLGWKNAHLALGVFLPLALISFLASSSIPVTYRHLSGKLGKTS